MISQRRKRVKVGDDSAKLVSDFVKEANMISQRRKKVKVGDDSTKLVSDFLKEAYEDILLEIFVRLPNCRSAILFGSACQCWHSLISQPQFIPRFISQHHEHQDRYSPPYTMLFRKADKRGWKVIRPESFQPICKLFSEESMFLHGKAATAATYLDFLPSPMFIRASCNDLLLVSPSERTTIADRYICNPITRQFYQLPKIRRSSERLVTGHALVCMPTNTNQFKVVEFQHPQYGDPELEPTKPVSLAMTIFSSNSGKWKRKCFHYPRPKNLCLNYSVDVVTCNGIVYWLEYEFCVDRVIALDLLNSHCGVIVFPDDFWWFRLQQDSHSHSDVREQIGVVGGELRLLQVVLTGVESTVNLKVWELNYNKDDSSWVLVHDKKDLRRPGNEEQLVAPFLHPTNGDVVFMVWGKNICQYNLIMEDTYEMIDELQESLNFNNRKWIENDRLMSFPMVYPAWPTPLLSGRRLSA